jgi:hypothetical protein
MRETFDIRSAASYSSEGVFRERLRELMDRPMDTYYRREAGLQADEPPQYVRMYWGEYATAEQIRDAWVGATAVMMPHSGDIQLP